MAYAFKRACTQDHDLVPSTQSNFPVLVSFTDDTLRSVAEGGKIENEDGDLPGDLAFYAESSLTTLLDFEIEKWDPETGELLAWVRLDSMSDSEDTVFYMAYGDSGVTSSPQDPAGVWDSNFHGVYHNPATGVDSTGNGNDGTPNNTPTTVAGKVGDGGDFEDGSAQTVSLPQNFQFSDLTYSAWVNAESFPQAYNGVLIRSNGTIFTQLLVKSTGKLACYGKTSLSTIFYDGGGAHTLSTGTWYYLTMAISSTLSPTRLDGYVNETADGSDTDTNDVNTGSVPISIAGNAGAEWDGLLDEVRISNVYRSADWVTCEYRSMVDPEAFVAVGAEVAAGGGGARSWGAIF